VSYPRPAHPAMDQVRPVAHPRSAAAKGVNPGLRPGSSGDHLPQDDPQRRARSCRVRLDPIVVVTDIEQRPARSIEMGTGRVEAFSDSVMAVIITIMAFELRPPHGVDLGAIRDQSPGLLVYVLSFVFVGIYWNNHHHIMRAAERING